jgi:hypothetical protein
MTAKVIASTSRQAFSRVLPIGLFTDRAASADRLGSAHQQLQLLENRGHRLERFELEPHLRRVQRRLGELAPAIGPTPSSP